jgi:hypothetical protein
MEEDTKDGARREGITAIPYITVNTTLLLLYGVVAAVVAVHYRHVGAHYRHVPCVCCLLLCCIATATSLHHQ